MKNGGIPVEKADCGIVIVNLAFGIGE